MNNSFITNNSSHDWELSDHGFLLDSSKWNREFTELYAAQLEISLTDLHWEVINWSREFYALYNKVPGVRLVIRQLKTNYDSTIANSVTLQQLFPPVPAQTIAKLAGLPKSSICL